MRAVGPRTNRLRGADPCRGICVDQRREDGSASESQCTELIQASTVNRFHKGAKSGCTAVPRSSTDPDNERCSVDNGTLNNTASVLQQFLVPNDVETAVRIVIDQFGK